MSLRRRVLLGCVAVALVLLAADVALTSTFRGFLLRRVDQQLAETVDRIADFASGPGRPAPRPGGPGGGPGGGPRGAGRPLSEYYVGVADADGTLLGRINEPLRGGEAAPDPRPAAVVAAATGPRESPRPFTVGERPGWRMIVVRPRRAGDELILVGASLRDVDPTYRRMVTVLIAATLAVLATLAAVAWWVLRQGVRPLTAMAATAGAIAEGALHERVADVDERTEAGRLGVALNTMLARIEQAFAARAASEERLRRFVADASHELRTPLTSISGYAELYRAGGLSEPKDLRSAMRRVEQEAGRMGALVEDLLLLAKLDEGRPLEARPVDLGALATDAAADLRAVEPDRPVTVEAAAVRVVGDDARLRQAVGNLLANARAHTPRGTPVHLRVTAVHGWALLDVADEGPGMPAEVADRVFERFYRADPARARASGRRGAARGGRTRVATSHGSGLGLAIVASVVAAHGGDVGVEAAPGRGARFRLRLPLAPQDHRTPPTSSV